MISAGAVVTQDVGRTQPTPGRVLARASDMANV